MQDSNRNNSILVEEKTSKRRYLQIADQLARMIADGEVRPEERFPAERDLAARFAVSRQTVREALIALEVSGLVDIKPGSGVYALRSDSVKGSLISEDAPGPLEIMQARIFVESEAAALAAVQISNEELLKLKVYLNQMDSLVTEESTAQAEEIDRKFHLLIAEAARNSALYTMIEWLWELRCSSEISRVFSHKLRTQGVKPNMQAHNDIYENISRRDPAGAKKAMKDHLAQTIEAYVLIVSDSHWSSQS